MNLLASSSRGGVCAAGGAGSKSGRHPGGAFGGRMRPHDTWDVSGGYPADWIRSSGSLRASATTMHQKTEKVNPVGSCKLIDVIDEQYRPTVAQLRAFAAVAENRHFGTAAQRLGVSQPTLSQALASLEAGLGVQLIERSTRKVLVTDAGRELLAKALGALEAVDGFVSAAAGVGEGLTGALRLGIIPTVAPYVLPTTLPALRRAYPGLHPHLVEDQTERLLAALRDGSLDVGVMALPSGGSGMVEIPLFDEDFALVVPEGHRLAGREDLSAAVLDDLPLLLLDEGHCLRDQTLDLCRLVGASPVTGDTRATSLATVVQCAAAGLGVTLVPESAVEAETARGGMATARFADPAPGRTIGLVYRTSSGRDEDFRALASLFAASAAAGRAYTV